MDSTATIAVTTLGLPRGGLAQVIEDTVKGLLKRGHTVEIIECLKKTPPKEHILPKNIKRYYIYAKWMRWITKRTWIPRPKNWRWRILHRILRKIAEQRFLRKIETLSPDIIIAQNPMTAAYAAKTRRPRGREGERERECKEIPIVGVLHGDFPRFLEKIKKSNTDAQKANPSHPPIAWGVVNPRIAPNVAQGLDIEENKIIDLTNGCDTEQVARMARETNPTANANTILWAHRFAGDKRGADAINAFAIARRQRPMQLLMLGEGGRPARLQALADKTGFGDDILMPGWSKNPYPDMAACGAFLSTAEREGFGMSMVQALSLGTFCISTDAPYGPRHILNDPRLGKLVPIGDTGALAEAMLAALELRRTEPPEARKFRARNIRERFGMEAAIDRYHQLAMSLKNDT